MKIPVPHAEPTKQSQAWWHMLGTPVLERQRQTGPEDLSNQSASENLGHLKTLYKKKIEWTLR